MNVNVSGAFIYYTIPIFGGINITQTLVSSVLVTVILLIAFVKLGKNLKKRPDGKQVLVEKGVSMIYDLTTSTMGQHNAKWAPLMGAIFLSSLFGSFIGLTGFLRSVTADLSCTLVWSLMVTAIIWYQNIKHNGFFGWLKGFTQPVKVMTPMNLISEIAQPASMAFRHFGNIAGGGVISSILYLAFGLLSTMAMNALASIGWVAGVVLMVAAVVVWIFAKKQILVRVAAGIGFFVGVFGILQALGILSDVPVLAVGIPAVLSLYFDLFSGFVQALVFTLLSMVYIAGSLPEPEENK